jgi:parvulin-like peptidyl-prolyl isomerase
MRRSSFLFAAVAFSAASIAAPLANDSPLIVEGPITVTAGDFEGYMLRVPQKHRTEVRASYDRVATIVDNMFISRSLAERARAAGMDQDPAVRRRLLQVQDNLLADLYVQKLEDSAPKVDLEPRARELYKGAGARFAEPEQVHVQQILVSLRGRTPEMALEKAREIHAQIVGGKADFLELAARLSEDPDKKRNGGDLGYNLPNSFTAPFAERVAKMTKPGEISEPVASDFGYHIIRFIDRKPAQTRKFEDVRQSLIQEEADRITKKRREDLIRSIRSSPTVVVHRDNVQALVHPLGDVLPQASAGAAAAAK